MTETSAIEIAWGMTSKYHRPSSDKREITIEELRERGLAGVVVPTVFGR